MRKKKQGIIKRMARRTANALAMLILLSLLLSLYGCEAKKDSIEEDLQSLEASESSGEAGKTGDGLKKQLHVPKELHIKALSEDGMRGYQADCEVDVPINASPPVYQQRKLPFTRENIIKKAESLFDEGKFTYVKPLDCYTLDELNEEEKRIEEEAGKENDAEQQDYFWNRSSDIGIYQEYFKETEVKEFKEGDFTEGSATAFYDKIMIMEGKIGGTDYQLLAFTSAGHQYLKLCKRSHGYGLTQGINYFGYEYNVFDIDSDGTAVKTEEPDTYDTENLALVIDHTSQDDGKPTEELKEQYGEKICSYSEEEAGRLALQYASLFGDTDMAIAKTNWLYLERGHKLSSDKEEASFSLEQIYSEPKGYAFYLQRQYGGLSCNESNFWWREITDGDKDKAMEADPSGIVTEQESYRVAVTDEGVVFVDTIEPWYEVTNTMSDSTSLMDFPDIEELAKGYFEEMAKNTDVAAGSGKNIIRINEAALRYATVLYDGEYTLIPCWFFNRNEGTQGSSSTILVINAIDGTKVFMRRMP